MISPKEVITYIKQGNYDPDWRIYRGRGKYGRAIPLWIIGVSIFLFGILTWSGTKGVLFLFWGIPCAGFIIGAVVCQLEATSDQRSFLVLLPKGVVQCYAGDPDNHSWLYFPSIYRIGIAQETEIGGIDGDISSRTDYWLDVYGIDGSYRKWEIDDCFGDTAYICKTIIAAYNHYRRYNQFG